MRWLGAWVLVGCGGAGSADTTPTDDADADTDSDTDADTDSDADTDAGQLFFEASGTFDGETVTLSCDEQSEPWEFYASQATDGSGTYALGGACLDGDPVLVFNLGVTTDGPASVTVCSPGDWGIQVYAFGTVDGWNCALNGVDRFAVDVDEMVVEPDGSVLWGGTFDAAGTGTVEVDLAGAFRWRSPPPL